MTVPWALMLAWEGCKHVVCVYLGNVTLCMEVCKPVKAATSSFCQHREEALPAGGRVEMRQVEGGGKVVLGVDGAASLGSIRLICSIWICTTSAGGIDLIGPIESAAALPGVREKFPFVPWWCGSSPQLLEMPLQPINPQCLLFSFTLEFTLFHMVPIFP